MRQYKIILISVVILIFISISGCIDDDNIKDEDMTSYFYKLEITPTTNSSYQIIVPIFVLENNSISQVNDQLTILFGKGTFQLTDTIHGSALLINSSEKFTIYLNGSKMIDFNLNDEMIPSIYLSMNVNNSHIWKTCNEHYWIYSNTPNNNVTVELYAEIFGEIGDGGRVTIQSDVSQGWNMYNGEMTRIGSPI